MNRPVINKLFWTTFGVGEVALLSLLLVVVNSGYSWADVGGFGVLVLLAGMGGAAGVFLTARGEAERRWCLLAALGLLAVAGTLLLLAR